MGSGRVENLRHSNPALIGPGASGMNTALVGKK